VQYNDVTDDDVELRISSSYRSAGIVEANRYDRKWRCTVCESEDVVSRLS
jgi:hypothetical protein